MPSLLFFLLVPIAIFLLVGFFLFRHWRRQGEIARALGMQLFTVRVPREYPKEGQEQKKEREMIGVMEQLYSLFSNFHTTEWQRFFYGEPYVALELAVHHKGEEIHFYVGAPRAYSRIVEKQILGLYPTAEVTAVKDYNIFNPRGAATGSWARLRRHPLLPLRTYEKLEADPLGEILTAMSKLQEEGEGAALQLLIRPSKNKKIKKIAAKAAGELKKGSTFEYAFEKAKANEWFEAGKEVALELTSPATLSPDQIRRKEEEKKRAPLTTPYHEELAKTIVEKAARAAFDVNLRLIASAATEARATEILHDMESAFVQFGSPDLNDLIFFRGGSGRLDALVFDFSFRLFRPSEAMHLTTNELSSLYHFPLPTTPAPRVKFLKAKAAEPPADLPREGVVIGRNVYRGEERLVRLTPDDRRRHLYVIGQTGTGKTTFLQSLIAQDIMAGQGVAVIDPHGDLIQDILGIIPDNRAEDVILFNPGDIAYPVGLNILEIDPAQPQQKSFVIDDFYKILKMIYKDTPEAFGPIFEKFFKNSLMLLLNDYQNEIPTIADVSRVFADKAYRDDKLSRETNPEIVRFWKFEAEKMSGEWSLPNMSGYITSKFSSFMLNEYVRPIITQQKSAFNFRDAMDNRKIILVNLSKGTIGELNANLLGMIVVSKILVAAFSRVDTPDLEARKDFYLYIDEFQNFTTESIATILSEARKYRLDLVIAHQFMKQLQENIRNAVLGNVGSMAVFRIGEEDAEVLKTRFEPVFSPQDMVNVDNFNAYVKLLIRNQTSRPFNIQVIPGPKGDSARAEKIRALSQMKYGRERGIVEREFQERQVQNVGPAPVAPPAPPTP